MKLKYLFLLMFMSVGIAASAWKPIFVGHRGSYRGVANTAEAYRNGVDYYHYTGLECDVRVTKDGHYVILHDNTTGSLCDVDIDAQQSTLAELKALDLRQTRGGVTYTGKICTVEEYLDICVEKNAFPIIELKWTTGINTNDMSNFAGLLALVDAKGLRQKAIFLTSMNKSIEHIKQNYPDLTCQYLLSSDSDTKFEFCKKWNVNPSFSAGALTPAIVTRYREAGFEVAAWTVNTEANYRKYGEMGCFMMTCDYLRPDDMPELEEPKKPEPSPDAIEIETQVLWSRSANDGTLPENFPSKAGTLYKTGQQAAMINGVFYVNDYGTKNLLVFDQNCTEPTVLPFSDVSLGGSPIHGVTTDDADNIVLRYETSVSATPSKVRLFKKGETTPVEVEFTINKGGQNNFVYASGDLFSAEGGCLYFMPNKQNTVTVVKIANGQLVDVVEHGGLSISGSTASVILPIDNNPDHFIYQVRNSGFYRFNGEDKGSVLTSSATTTAPGRNSSLGGALMKIQGHDVLAYPSGTNYNGGMSLMDVTADNTVLATFPSLGSQGYTVNASTGTFMRPVKMGDDIYHLHHYTMGNGYGVYEIKAKGVSGVSSIAADKTAPEVSLFPNPVVSATVVSSKAPLGNISLYSMNSVLVYSLDCGEAQSASLDLGHLARGLYILRCPGRAAVKLVKL